MKNEESRLQKACVNWFRMQYPLYLIYANANGGARDAITGAIMKAEGVLAGVPDLTIVTPFETFWIEMKTPKGRVSESQKSIIDKLRSLEKQVFICYSVNQFIEIVNYKIKGL